MRDQCTCWKRILMIFLGTILVCGCLAKTAGMHQPLPEFLTNLSRTISPAERIIAIARIDLMTAQGHYPVRAALIIQKPSYLRLEILPVIGTPDFFLVATPGDMKIWIPSQGEFYRGKPSAANLERFLNWGMNVDDLVSIFTGTYPSLGEEPAALESSEEGGRLRLEMKSRRGPSQTLWLNKDKVMTGLIRYDSAGRELYSVSYDDYGSENPLPGKISIRSADGLTSVTVIYSELKIEKAADMTIFELPVPANAKVLRLD